MKKHIDNIDALAGKTIDHAWELLDSMLLVFSDDTYALIRSDMEGYSEPERTTPTLEEMGAPSFEQQRELYVESGIYTADEFNAALAKLDAERIAREKRSAEDQESRERREYERLKAKFGS